MKLLYFVSLIAAAGYLLAFLPKLRTRREPVAYWGCWAYLGLNAVYWAIFAFRYYFLR
ncbi:hypothetical protein ACWXWB_01730 [Pantoea dispersa]|uniref:hypothetical protein n=1 Tax=Pantoea dispersa TaxID=59814 RepID=UPI002DB61673|nr:hypothetical protein [Pantoea dispersa]MEB5971674.1 hypothetical protein [Pantoea dispersa]